MNPARPRHCQRSCRRAARSSVGSTGQIGFMHDPLAPRRWEGRADPPRARKPARSFPHQVPRGRGAGSIAGPPRSLSFQRFVAAFSPRPFAHCARTGLCFLASEQDVRRSQSGCALLCAAIVATACGGDTARDARDARAKSDSAVRSGIDVTDDAGFAVHLAKPAQRVISLIPSAMETLDRDWRDESDRGPHALRRRTGGREPAVRWRRRGSERGGDGQSSPGPRDRVGERQAPAGSREARGVSESRCSFFARRTRRTSSTGWRASVA